MPIDFILVKLSGESRVMLKSMYYRLHMCLSEIQHLQRCIEGPILFKNFEGMFYIINRKIVHQIHFVPSPLSAKFYKYCLFGFRDIFSISFSITTQHVHLSFRLFNNIPQKVEIVYVVSKSLIVNIISKL